MLSGHRIPSPMCLAVGWKIHFHLRTRMLLSEDGEQVEATIHSVAQVTNLRQRGIIWSEYIQLNYAITFFLVVNPRIFCLAFFAFNSVINFLKSRSSSSVQGFD